MAGQKGGAKQLVWLTYERSRHLSPSPGLHHPSEQPQRRLRPTGQGESVASLAFFGRARYNRWLDSRRYRFAPNGERPAFLSLPISPAVSFANHQSLITWSALVAATPRCVPCVLCGYSWSDRYYSPNASDTAVTRGRGPPVPPSRRSISSKRRIRSSTSLRR